MLQVLQLERLRIVRIACVTVVGVALVCVAVALFLAGRSLVDPQAGLSIAHLMQSGSSQRGISEPVDTTREVCQKYACVEAFDTAEAVYLRFATREDAAKYVEESPDAFQSNYIVMDFSAKTSAEPERQRLAMEFLVSTWQDYEGTLPARG